MIDKFQINPFDRSALTDLMQLAGRSDEFRQIRFVLRTAARNKNRIKNILLIGERGVGKTSMLNLIESECETNNIISIRVDCTTANSSSSIDFFWHLFSQVSNKLFSLGYMGGKGGSIDKMIQNILNSDGVLEPANWVFKTPILRKNFLYHKDVGFEFHSLISDLKIMRKEVMESSNEKTNELTKLLILVDESQHLFKHKEIIEEIRYIIQSQDLGVGFVFAGDSSYKTSAWEEVFGGSYRDFDIINLPYFETFEDVSEYFEKSLKSIGWTENDIEERLFYRFKVACRNIYKLTSGKPAWINTIASKMFERCMSGEVKQLRFDKQAQLNVKKMLEGSGEIDTNKIAFIEGLSTKFESWLAEIFASQLYTFRQVYFYAKFKLGGAYSLGIEDFEMFCKDLVSRKIISLIEKESSSETPNSQLTADSISQLDKNYYAFNLKLDTTKQWLQINSDGKYSFRYQAPSIRFMSYINDELVSDKYNSEIITSRFNQQDESFRLLEVIDKINRQGYDVSEETFETLSALYKFCKILEDSATKQVLYVVLSDKLTNKNTSWNIYNYNDKEKIIAFRESPSTTTKIKELVKKYNNQSVQYELDIQIDKFTHSNISTLQKLIIRSGDTKKIGIILEAKTEDLYRLYIKESNIESSYEIAQFMLSLFEEGHDLRLKDLNNAAYVFIEKDQLQKASTLLYEGKRKIISNITFKEDQPAACLIFYNLAITEVKRNHFEMAMDLFEQLNDYIEENELSAETAAALKYLKLSDGKIEVHEAKDNDKAFSKIITRDFANTNLEVLRGYLVK